MILKILGIIICIFIIIIIAFCLYLYYTPLGVFYMTKSKLTAIRLTGLKVALIKKLFKNIVVSKSELKRINHIYNFFDYPSVIFLPTATQDDIDKIKEIKKIYLKYENTIYLRLTNYPYDNTYVFNQDQNDLINKVIESNKIIDKMETEGKIKQDYYIGKLFK